MNRPPSAVSPPSHRIVTLAVMMMLWYGGRSPGQTTETSATTYLQKSSVLANDDLAGHLALAQWCEDHRLYDRAAHHYRHVLELDGDQQSAYDRLIHLADTHRLPEDPARQEALKAEFGDGFKLHVTDHFLVIYNTEENWARNRAALLEKTHDVYYQTFERLGYRPMPLSERLVCVLFDSFQHYRHYVRRADGALMTWAAGYYSSRHNRSAFYHDRDNPAYTKVKQRMVALEQAANALTDRLRQAADQHNFALVQTYRRQLQQTRKELTWYTNRLNAVAQLANTAKTIHEAVHQLAYNSAIQRRGRMYPFWLSEGLATNFETDTPTRPFGPMYDNPGRRKILTDALADNRLIPLDQFIGIAAYRNPDAAQVSAAYAQAWALFRFLLRYHRSQMPAYLKTLADAPFGRRSPEQLRKEFIAAFGPMDTLSQRWETYLQQIRKPLHVSTDVFQR